MSLVYLYDGSFDGLLTAIFEAYARRQQPDAIAEEENLQVAFGQQTVRIETDTHKAQRVENGIVTKLGSPVHQKIWTVYLAASPDKASIVYRYVRRGLAVGRRVYSDLAHTDVLAIDKLYALVSREAHLLKEFLRFSLMEGGVYYAKISPEHGVVPLIMPHFVDRYGTQPFLIHDNMHGIAGVYGGNGWHMVETRDLALPEEAEAELQYKRMWKQFYDTIAIRERMNPRCRRAHMPKKYWKNMTELNFVETPKTRAQDARAGRQPPQSLVPTQEPHKR